MGRKEALADYAPRLVGVGIVTDNLAAEEVAGIMRHLPQLLLLLLARRTVKARPKGTYRHSIRVNPGY